MKRRRVLLLGATGLVGSELLPLLADEVGVDRILVLGRRAATFSHPKVEQHVIDMSAMAKHAQLFAVDQIFCALGTTIKVAGSQEKFRQIDHDFPVEAARLGLEGGATHYLLVSALGSNAKSRVFYNRVKGETEDDIRALGYRSFTIARPSLLLGDRAEHRRGEEIGKRLSWLVPKKYKPIQARAVARAMGEAARADEPGVRVMDSREMNK